MRFAEHGAVATDHGVQCLSTERLEDGAARRIFAAALRGEHTRDEAAPFSAHMLDEMARMSCEDGLVMQLHPGVLRDHHRATLTAHGPDAGADIPLRAEFTRALRPLLGRYGTHPRLRLVLFTVDETAFARELAPLAGFYPSVYLGAPWWFLDSPAGMLRFRQAVTDSAGFRRTAGFVDDARALCSIPARHDVAARGLLVSGRAGLRAPAQAGRRGGRRPRSRARPGLPGVRAIAALNAGGGAGVQCTKRIVSG